MIKKLSYRDCRFKVAKREVATDGIDAVDNRTVELAFSSETPADREFGVEILGHKSTEVRLDRLRNAANLLVDHDPCDVVGVVEDVSLDEKDGIARATVRFGNSARATEIYDDVLNGIRTSVSVGYVVHNFDEQPGKIFRATDWEPLEISLVAIPVDTRVGVGRAHKLATTPTTNPATIKEQSAMSDPQTQAIDAEARRRDDIIAIAGIYDKYIRQADVFEALQKNISVEAFKDSVMKKMADKHQDTSSQYLGFTAKDAKKYSFSRAIMAQLTNDWSQAGLEQEASRALAHQTGMTPSGFFVPYDVFRRDFNVGTAAEAGNLVATELRTDMYTDVLRNALALSQLGTTMLMGLSSNVDIPRKISTAAISAVTEIQALTESQPNTAKITLSSKRKGSFVEYSKQALIQSGIALDAMLRKDLLDNMAVTVENDCINGNGIAPNLRGIRNTVGINSVAGGVNGLALNWTNLVALESACANANAEPDRVSGYLINTKARGTAKNTQKAANLPFIWDGGATPLNSYRAVVSNNVPSNLTKGTSAGICSSVIYGAMWDMAVLAFFGVPDIVVDGLTLASTGQVRITLNQFVDFGIRQPAAFAVMDDTLTP